MKSVQNLLTAISVTKSSFNDGHSRHKVLTHLLTDISVTKFGGFQKKKKEPLAGSVRYSLGQCATFIDGNFRH
jgi:hypothetical protein